MTHHCPRSNWTGPESELRNGICPGCAGTTLYEDCEVRRVDGRRPPPPEVLADALQDRIHSTSGRLLRVQPIIGARERREVDAMRRELEALRALERHVRSQLTDDPRLIPVLDLLKAIDEARK